MIKDSKERGQKYFEAVGRRKTAVARVRLSEGKGITVNNKNYADYFTINRLKVALLSPLKATGMDGKFGASIVVRGGGPKAQAEAARHGIARALVNFDASFKKRLREFGFLTRDSRMVERKKYGLKKARRAPQWSKR